MIAARQTGAALMLVMWFVAALSIIALSLSAGARIDLRGTNQFVDMARVEALAQTASNLILLEFETDRAAFEQNFRREYQYDGHTLVAEIRPDGAFVNLNTASNPLLQALFVHVGEVPADDAEALVRMMVEWRAASATGDSSRAYENAGVTFRPRYGRFEAPEDLMQVLGVSYDTYAKIADLLTVYGSASGVDPRYAPVGALLALAEGDHGVAQQIEATRGESVLDTNFTDLNQSLVGRAGDGIAYRLDVTVEIGGVHYVRRGWYEQGTGGRNPESWRALSVDTVMIAGKPPAPE